MSRLSKGALAPEGFKAYMGALPEVLYRILHWILYWGKRE